MGWGIFGGGSSASSNTSTSNLTNNTQADTTSTGDGLTLGSGSGYQVDNTNFGEVGQGSDKVAGSDNFLENISGVKVGNNSVFTTTAMDANTRSILDQSLTVVAANANNMMTLAAGRDPNTPLADKSVEITAKTDQIGTALSGVADIFTPARLIAMIAGLLLFIWIVMPGKKRKAA